MRDALELVATVAAAVVAVSTVMGLGARYVLVPYLRDQLRPIQRKVDETHQQITVNSHSLPEPTVRDNLSDVLTTQESMSQQLHVLAMMYEHHMNWSDQETGRLWRALRNLERRVPE